MPTISPSCYGLIIINSTKKWGILVQRSVVVLTSEVKHTCEGECHVFLAISSYSLHFSQTESEWHNNPPLHG